MEERLLLLKEEGGGIKEEVKRLGWVAAPMVAVNTCQYLLQSSALTMVGHLGEFSLAATALAVSITAVTGFSLVVGMASGIETLCGQAYGAQQYQKLGTKTYTAILSLTLSCFPISILWFNLHSLLILTGQDPLISHEARRYAICLIPSLFAFATLQPVVRFLQAQSLIMPMVLSSFLALTLHLPLCWVLVFKTEMGSIGAAVATAVSTWFNVAFLCLYVKFSKACERTRSPITVEVLSGVGEFFRFALPSAGMICLEWWSFEAMILISGLLPNPALETSVLSVCLTTIGTLYALPAGVGAAASTRVSNELGAGNPDRARTAVYGAMMIASIEGITTSSVLFMCRRGLGYLFSDEKEVVDYVIQMAPFVSISIVLDSLQGAFSGIVRGSGRQHIAVGGVLGTYYFVGIPTAILLAFKFKLEGKGLWIGIQSGTFLQALVFALVTITTNWKIQARKARERLHKGGFEVTSHDNKEKDFFQFLLSSIDKIKYFQVDSQLISKVVLSQFLLIENVTDYDISEYISNLILNLVEIKHDILFLNIISKEIN
ncbi:uncharacterized protein [Phyllobates terribilis]|uniref:uncharacterized protein n=1 Tax=Phyllobates terribilis TaxID=111132 RepID=UPI003CCAD6C4